MEVIYKLDAAHTWALDFYFGRPVEQVAPDRLKANAPLWLYATEEQRERLGKEGFRWDRELAADQFRISRLQGRFLNPATREKVLRKRYLLHLTPP